MKANDSFSDAEMVAIGLSFYASIAMFCLAIVPGLLVAKYWRKWETWWAAAGIALAIWLPEVLLCLVVWNRVPPAVSAAAVALYFTLRKPRQKADDPTEGKN